MPEAYNNLWFMPSSKCHAHYDVTKKAVRIIAKTEFRAHTTPLFKKYGLLKIMDICQFQIALFMFKFTISKLPSIFNSYFT